MWQRLHEKQAEYGEEREMEILPPALLLSRRAAVTSPSYRMVQDLTRSLLETSISQEDM